MFLRRWLTKMVFHTHHGAFINAIYGRLSTCLHHKITRLAVEISDGLKYDKLSGKLLFGFQFLEGFFYFLT